MAATAPPTLDYIDNEDVMFLVTESTEKEDGGFAYTLTSVFLLVLFSVLIVAALAGNLLVCVAIRWDRNLRRSPDNLFLISLAVSDMLVSVLVMVFAAANDLLGWWPFGTAYCRFWISLDITCSTASILNLCAISLDRYWHISRPMEMYNKRRVYYGICVVWLLSALIGAAPFLIGGHTDDSASETSSLPTCEMRLPLHYAIGSSIASFFLPAAIMIFLYTKLYLYARRHVRSIQTQLKQATGFLIMQLASEKIREFREGTCSRLAFLLWCCRRKRNNSMANSSGMPESDGRLPMAESMTTAGSMLNLSAGGQAPKPPKSSVSDQKARLTLGVIMGTFLLCWIPFFVINIWRSVSDDTVSITLIQAVTWLGYSNSALNPVIYSIFNRDFRAAFHRILAKLVWCTERSRRGGAASNGNNGVPGGGGGSSHYALDNAAPTYVQRKISTARHSIGGAIENGTGGGPPKIHADGGSSSGGLNEPTRALLAAPSF